MRMKQTKRDEFMEMLKDELNDYLLQHPLCYEGGSNLPLVDALTPTNASSINKGIEEIELLADHLAPSIIKHFLGLLPEEKVFVQHDGTGSSEFAGTGCGWCGCAEGTYHKTGCKKLKEALNTEGFNECIDQTKKNIGGV